MGGGGGNTDSVTLSVAATLGGIGGIVDTIGWLVLQPGSSRRTVRAMYGFWSSIRPRRNKYPVRHVARITMRAESVGWNVHVVKRSADGGQ